MIPKNVRIKILYGTQIQGWLKKQYSRIKCGQENKKKLKKIKIVLSWLKIYMF